MSRCEPLNLFGSFKIKCRMRIGGVYFRQIAQSNNCFTEKMFAATLKI